MRLEMITISQEHVAQVVSNLSTGLADDDNKKAHARVEMQLYIVVSSRDS